MRAWIFALILGVLLGIGPLVLRASPQDDAVKPTAGPWLICVASFTGTTAPSMAEELAAEIRHNYQMPAFLYNRGADERKKQQEEFTRLKQLCPEGRFRSHRIEEQFAVLVGGYKDMETARKALDEIRKLKPPSKKFMDRQTITQASAIEGATGGGGDSLVSPFLRAFVARNPAVPHEATQEPQKPDPFLWELNSGESFNALKCRKPWTLVVRTYMSPVQIQGRSDPEARVLGKSLFGGSNSGKYLTANGLQAHSLAELLRKMGHESYVLHTRHQSIVCVGNYDKIDDAALLTNQKALANLKLGAVDALMAQPLPMEIPRK